MSLAAPRALRAWSRCVGFVDDAVVCLCWIRAPASACEWPSIAFVLVDSVGRNRRGYCCAGTDNTDAAKPKPAPTPTARSGRFPVCGIAPLWLADCTRAIAFGCCIDFERLFQRGDLLAARRQMLAALSKTPFARLVLRLSLRPARMSCVSRGVLG